MDEYDRRITLTYVEEYFDEFLFNVNPIFTLFFSDIGGVEFLSDQNKEDYIGLYLYILL